MALPYGQHDVPQSDFERLSGAADAWDEGLGGQILSADYFAEQIVSGGLVSVWNGTAWVDKPVKVWDGAAWVTKPLKRWTGSAWV